MCAHMIDLSLIHHNRIYRPNRTVMATPVTSSSQPALQGPHARDSKKPKEKKDKAAAAAAAASQYPLEVSDLTP